MTIIDKFNKYATAKYFLLKELGIESIPPKDINIAEDDIASYIWIFKENFFKERKMNPIFAKLSNYKEEALNYLDRTYPYSFEIGGHIRNEVLDNDLSYFGGNTSLSLDNGLYFYALHKGAKPEELGIIIEYLKQIPLTPIATEYEEELKNTEQVMSYVGATEINGSTVQKYQAQNLYEALTTLDDKHISNFISYLVMHPGNAMQGISGYRAKDGQYYVSEGNHRVMTEKAMQEIDKLLGKQAFAIAPLKMTISRTKTYNKGL